MKKHINSATVQYQDEYTDNWVLDDTPTEGSFNAVTSDGVAKAIEQGGGGGTTYTAGNMISLANDAIAVSTTAGITDIQQVAALPASPVSTVLYLIPEA